MGVLLCGCVALMLSGYNLALMGNVSSTPSYLNTVELNDGSDRSQLLIGMVNSLYWIGVWAGAMLIGPLSDSVGRRKALVTAGLFGLIILPLFAALQNFNWAWILRLLNGVVTGAFDSVVLNWSAETADHQHRGRVIGFEMASAALGACQAYFLTYGLGQSSTGQLIWRLPCAYQLIFVLFILVLVWFLPESPRWLLSKGFFEETRAVLISLRADRGERHEVEAAIDADISAMQTVLKEESANNASHGYRKMLFAKDNLHTARRSWSAIFIQFVTQAFVGSGIVSGYGMKIFATGGWPSDTSALLGGMGIVTQALFGILGALIADKIGRRRAMVYGALYSSALLGLIGMSGYYVAAYEDTDPARLKTFSIVTVALVLAWSAGYGMTWLWAPFVYPAEIFPAKSRARGSSLGIVGLSTGSFVVNMISPYIFASIGYKSLFLFCGLSLAVSGICYLFMPETAGKTLEEIDDLFN
ncbi:hypothetical protein diail_8178 [Diaporthe ilicicola]|nr:hypothetical protein diail_8178 [Diaporthe ilicicola]